MPMNLSFRNLLSWRALPPAVLVGLVAILGPGLRSGAAAQDPGDGPACRDRALRGAYGLVGNGELTGVRGEGIPVSGTYFVNPDCTGGQTTFVPGVPPLEDRFVIVDNGREVRTVVISPITTIGTANLRKR